MLTIATAALQLAVLAGAPAAPGSGCGAQPRETVLCWFAAFNRHDAAAIERLYAPDAVLRDPDHRMLRGNKPIAATYRSLFRHVPDVHDRLLHVDVAGRRVYVEFISTGSSGGKTFHLPILSVLTVEGGRIVEDSTYFDRQATG